MAWNPDQYHKFRAAREQPALDLQAMIPDLPYRRVADLGCGTGEQTLALAQRFPGAAVMGIDASAEMLAQAQAHTAAHLSFRQSDLRELDGTYDLLYSNAALQWLPDHPALLAGLWERLNPGGVLAVQVPANHDHVSHRLITETADEFTARVGRLHPFRAGAWGHTCPDARSLRRDSRRPGGKRAGSDQPGLPHRAKRS
ncbi:methyltransferase domain-containing protein [Deinococcus radiophilus]|uniref:methyltransferase domain-containing protein n=1 Tax=Deinococcus radiophilus TaxID=32062 RepID=UPI002D1FAA28|nr:methyltransferase domain-containing protein [Deinococcus radiophilus]